ncbi:MAG: ATP-binding protein [Methylovulum miyakonense]|uniref:ATP-binding protein n=1 Tax=Methylovulum miyakonense TaxID=645578 RepID=UPI003BB76BC6
MPINNKRYSALNIGAVIISLVWLAHIFAVFNPLNGFAYDHLMRNYINASASGQLIVFDGDQQYAERGDEVWLPLLKGLLAQDAKQVVFNFLPERVSANFYQLAADSGKVVFGRHVLNSDPYSPPTLQALPVAALGKNLTVGLVEAAPNQSGIYRTQRRTIGIDGRSFASLEYRTAQTLLGGSTALAAPDYLINFIGGSARIPKVKLAQAAAGGLVKELIAGHTVLVGIYGLEPLSTYFTPLSTASHETSDVLYHAFGMDTLLAQRTIGVLPDIWMLPLISLITLATLMFCQQMDFQHALGLSLVFSLVYTLACWLALQGMFFWVPPVPLLTAQWLAFAVAWRYRIVQENQVLDIMLFNLSVNLQEKAFPVSFYYSQDPWGQLIIMINQTLNLNRMIFLERVPDDHRLKEIKAFNCSISDVGEARRDFHRTPYSTVIQEQKPLLLERPYLKPLAIEEQQYLAPLIFAGDILGFWAFTVASKAVQPTQKFLDLTHAFMTQISEILYYRQEWQKREAQEQNNMLSYLSFSQGSKPYQMLSKSLVLLDKRIAELQQVFNSLNTGGVLYDLFGRVLLLNNNMEELAKSEDLKLYNLTAMDFIAAVTGYDATEARLIMQKAIFDREMLSLPIPHFKAGRDFILHIQPLKLQDMNLQTDESVPVFEIIGILCELEDVTELKAIYRLKEQMFERFNFQMRNDFATMVFALTILEDAATSTAEKGFALSSIKGKIEETLATLESVNAQMNIDIESLAENLGCYPINGQEALKKAVSSLTEYAALRAIKIQVNSPRLLSLVLASPNELYSTFHTLLTIMLNDTFEGSDVWITIEEKNEWVHFFFRNNGIGIASNKLQQLDGQSPQLLAEELEMDEVAQAVKFWGGHIEFSSQLGKGSTVTLMLKRFL